MSMCFSLTSAQISVLADQLFIGRFAPHTMKKNNKEL